MVTIAHISDLHCSKTRAGKTGFKPEKLTSCINEVNKLKPDVVIVTGDLTMFGFKEEYEMARKYLSKIKFPMIVIPGNHDARYAGYDYFDEFFGHGDSFLDLPGISIIGVDTSVPDVDDGHIGRGKLKILIERLNKIPSSKLKIVAMHHHLVSIPKTGRERATIVDAGDVLKEFVDAGVDLVLSGHKHAPYSWLINNVAIVNAGSASATKLRANIPNSYNIIKVENSSIEILLKKPGKKPEVMAKYTTATSEGELYVSHK